MSHFLKSQKFIFHNHKGFESPPSFTSMNLYRCSRCESEKITPIMRRPKCQGCETSLKMYRVDEGRKRNVSVLKPDGSKGQGGSAPNPHRCNLCGAYHSQHGMKAGTGTGLCHTCVASPPEDLTCLKTTTIGHKCRRIIHTDEMCTYHYNQSQSSPSKSKSSSLNAPGEPPNSSI
jgi:hypothetical protein